MAKRTDVRMVMGDNPNHTHGTQIAAGETVTIEVNGKSVIVVHGDGRVETPKGLELSNPADNLEVEFGEYRPGNVDLFGIAQCNRCGALVGREDLHADWHRCIGR